MEEENFAIKIFTTLKIFLNCFGGFVQTYAKENFK